MQFKNSVLAIFALAGLAGCATTVSPQEEVVTAQPTAVVTTETVVVPSELVTVRPAFISTWQGTDPAAFNVYFTENAVITTPTGTYTGWPDIHTRWLTPMMTGMSNYTVTPTAFTRLDNGITETGHYSYRVMHDGGHTEVRTVNYSQKWVQQTDGTWKLVSLDIK